MNTKFGFFPYQAMNYKAAQTWLNRRAEQDWELAHVYLGCIARFQKSEAPSHFVDLDIRSGFDEDTDADYLQLCTDAGWKLVQKLRGMLLFRSEPGKNPAPIQTDVELEWERFWERYRPRIWTALLTLLGVGLIAFMLTLPSTMNRTSALAVSTGLLYLIYLAAGLIYIVLEGIHSHWYLACCRKSGRVEDPGPISIFLDTICRLNTPLLCLILFAVIAEPFGFGRTVDLEWYSPNETYTATIEACREWPVVTAADLSLPNRDCSRNLEGFRSVLMDFLEYRELTDGEEPGDPHYILTTERYVCLNETLAKWALAQRREETRRGAFLWGELEWEPAPGLGFDECYSCRDNSYLLFRQGRVVVLVGCSDLDLTTAQNLEIIRTRTMDAGS